jgi:hypothetical protein
MYYPGEKLIHDSEDPSTLTSEITTVILVGKLAAFQCQPRRASLVGRHQQGEQGIVNGARASPVK